MGKRNPAGPSARGVDATSANTEPTLAARVSVAARLIASQPELLAFIRKRLGNAAASERSAEDIFSTMLRRSDALVRANALLAELSDAALLALASTISHRAILESGREAARSQRIRRAATERSRAKAGGAGDLRGQPDHGLEESIRSRLSDDDLAIIALRLSDQGWHAIAASIGTTTAGAHRRYYRALKALAAATDASNR
jgi:hypothetical protein